MWLRLVIISIVTIDCHTARIRALSRPGGKNDPNPRAHDRGLSLTAGLDGSVPATTQPIKIESGSDAVVTSIMQKPVAWPQANLLRRDRTFTHKVMGETPDRVVHVSPRVIIACGSWHALIACIITVMLALKFAGVYVSASLVTCKDVSENTNGSPFTEAWLTDGSEQTDTNFQVPRESCEDASETERTIAFQEGKNEQTDTISPASHASCQDASRNKKGSPCQDDESEQTDAASRVVGLNAVPLSRSGRLALKTFVLGSGFFTTLNCTIFMPDSPGVAENAGGGLILSGFFLGAYGLGGICGGFILRYLTHMSIKLSFQFVCLCMFVGNAIAVLSLLFPNVLPWNAVVFLSRVVAGMELGLEYTNHSLILGALNPSRDCSATTSLFSYLRGFQYAGAALGPGVAMACAMLGSNLSVSPAIPALLCMCFLAVVFGLMILLCFPNVQPPVYEAPSERKGHIALGQQMEVCASVIAFNVVTFLRHTMRLALEAGSLIVFEHSAGFSHTSAGYLTSAVMLVAIPSSFCVGMVLESRKMSNRRLMQVLQAVEVFAALGLFSIDSHRRFCTVLFICSSALFYGANSTVSNPLSGIYYASAIKGHQYLSKDKLIIFSTTAIQLGMAVGPVASRALSAWSGVGQNPLAFLILSNLVWQYVCCKVLLKH